VKTSSHPSPSITCGKWGLPALAVFNCAEALSVLAFFEVLKEFHDVRFEAFRHLDRTLESHDPGLFTLPWGAMDSLRADPRFDERVRRMGFH
jgi:hypothetical protein